MVTFYESIPEKLLPWVRKQKVFWVATAPLNPEGHVNVSPKGVDGTFHIVNPNKVWYQDLSGSGAETIAHIRENRRITIMLSAFEGAPNIVRFYGKGTVHEFGTPEYEAYIPPKERISGSRSVIVIDIHKVSTSCGYAVPFFTYKSDRTTLIHAAVKKEGVDRVAEPGADDPKACKPTDGLRAYWEKNNTKSLDGLTGLINSFNIPFTLSGYIDVNAAPGPPSAEATEDRVHVAKALQSAGLDLIDRRLLLGILIGFMMSSLCARLIQVG